MQGHKVRSKIFLVIMLHNGLIKLVQKHSKIEIMLKANSYTTGETRTAKATRVATCAWLFAYPYSRREINFAVCGMGFGMKAKRSLQQMEWVAKSFGIGPDGHKKVKRNLETFNQEAKRGSGYEEESPSYERKG